MGKRRKHYDYDDRFDDDFEVTYTEELPPVQPDFYARYEVHQSRYADNYTNEYEDDYEERPRRKRRSSRRRRPQELADPIQNMMYTGSTTAEKLTRLVFRPAPILMSGIITLITVFCYLSNSADYGNIAALAYELNYTLIAYLAVGAIIVLWEICCFFFTLSGVWSGTGRGLTFFILVYVLSYIASIAGNLIPENLAMVEGIRGGLAAYGSLYSMFFPFCIIGILTCILQKIMGRQ